MVKKLLFIIFLLALVSYIFAGFTEIAAGLTGVGFSSVAWGDYDSDGDLDILLTGYTEGTYISKVYRNDAGIFTDIAAGLTGVASGSAAWGDYDNDGDLDILLTGYGNTYISKVYRNDAGSFTDIAAGLIGVANSSVAWGDYDNDGDLDILLTGYRITYISKIYRNDAGSFTDIAAGYTGVMYSSVAWGDYDNDGDLDILLTGQSATSTFISKVYHNSAGIFTDIVAALTGVFNSSVAWGDYDNDGDLDILLTGYTGSTVISKVYRNDASSFTDIAAGLTGVANGSVAWGDYDNDGDLDILLTGYGYGDANISKVYRNDSNIHNTVPTAPANLRNSIVENYANLQWDAALDAQTPVSGLNYVLKIGTTPGGNQISAPMANSSGYRFIPVRGNANATCSWKIATSGLINSDKFYWSVQAIDESFSGSAFAPESSFQWIRLIAPNGGENWQQVSTTKTIYWSAATSISQVNILLSVDNGVNWIMLNSSPVTASLGRYSFSVPSMSSAQCLIKIINTINSNQFDVSDTNFTISSSPSPSLFLTAPTNAKLQTGKTYYINWIAIGISNIKLEYSLNAGVDWQTIAASITAGMGTYAWLVPNTPAAACYLRISDTTSPSVYDWCDESFSISSLQLTIPNGNEIWGSASAHSITWTSTNVTNVKLEYSLNNGSAWTQIIASVVASTGTYSWTVPTAISNQCRVRITDTTDAIIYDTSDTTFTIRPQIIVTAPNGSENYTVGSVYSILWTTTADVSFVLIDYSINNGTNWLTVQTSVYPASVGRYDWIVPNNPSTNCLIKVKSSANSAIYDVSDAVFTITTQIFPPAVNFSADVTEGLEALTVQFADQSTTGSGNITARLWNFGDSDTSTVQNPLHIFSNDGIYTVSLRVTNSYDSTRTLVKTDYIHVLPRYPGISLQSDASMDFGNVYLGSQSALQTVKFKNTGSSLLTVLSISFKQTNTLFGVTDLTLPLQIAIGESSFFHVRFTPQNASSIIDSLFIHSNAHDFPAVGIKLSGRGEIVPPKAPANIMINIVNNNAVISWEAVTQTIFDSPLIPDCYLVFDNGADNPQGGYSFLGISYSTSFTHNYVGMYAPFMFYCIKAFKNYSRSEDGIGDYHLKPGMTEEEVERILQN
jgi:hypothetical protein